MEAKLNQAKEENGVLTISIYLEGKPAAFAEAIGSLDLAKDLVKNYFQRKAIKEQMKIRANGIIKPGIH